MKPTKEDVLTPEFGRAFLKQFFNIIYEAENLIEDFYDFVFFEDESGYHLVDFIVEWDDGDYYDDMHRYIGQFEEAIVEAARQGLLDQTKPIWYGRVVIRAFCDRAAIVKYCPDALDELR